MAVSLDYEHWAQACKAYLHQDEPKLEPRIFNREKYDVGKVPFCAKGKYSNFRSFQYEPVDAMEPAYADIYMNQNEKGMVIDICDMRTEGRPDWPWYMRIPLNDVEANVEDDYIPEEGDYVPEKDDYVHLKYLRRKKKMIEDVNTADFMICGDYFDDCEGEDSEYIPEENLLNISETEEEYDEYELLPQPWEVKEETIVRPLDIAQAYKGCPNCQGLGNDFSPDKCTVETCGQRRWVVDALVYDYLVKFEDRMIDNMEMHGVLFV